ncbi:MAG: hypothetical protein A2V74_00570 [Acidobacteria bacterium RBG_16_70_10]|nr:MAG: hypothetical protein A2V74_00570 [Acidobacteria bacterium RBG_16_70_10]
MQDCCQGSAKTHVAGQTLDAAAAQPLSELLEDGSSVLSVLLGPFGVEADDVTPLVDPDLLDAEVALDFPVAPGARRRTSSRTSKFLRLLIPTM